MLCAENLLNHVLALSIELDALSYSGKLFHDLAHSLTTLGEQSGLRAVDFHLVAGSLTTLTLECFHAEARLSDSSFCVVPSTVEVVGVEVGIGNVETQLRKHRDDALTRFKGLPPHLLHMGQCLQESL